MNTAIFSIHCIAVFGVPFLFGWVLLRRVFRELSWVALIPGAMVTGVASLMALVNELRFFLEMRPALWFAYKLLLALALVLIVTMRPRHRPGIPGCARRTWQLVLLGFGAVAVGIYYGIPAASGYLNDSWWYHYPAAVQIQTSRLFPLHAVFALDDSLYYHYGPDVLAATWSSLLDRTVQDGFAINIIVLAPCSFLLSFALLSRITRSYWGSLLGASFLIAAGNLRFLLFLTGDYGSPVGALRVFNSQTIQGLQQLMFTPSHAVGIPLVLTLLLLFRHVQAGRSYLRAGAFGLLLGTLTLVAEWYFLPLLAGTTLVLLFGLWSRRGGNRFPERGRLALALLPAVAAVAWGALNHTYLAGAFKHFWMPEESVYQLAQSRQIRAKLVPREGPLMQFPEDVLQVDPPETITESILQPVWTVPDLVPLRLNLAHFGQVASWESAASDEGTFIPILGTKFLMEVSPVMLVGMPFGIWLAWRRRKPVVVLLALLAVVSAIPPVLLDWGYRSTDFLRFFTASFCFCALFLGMAAGELLTQARLGLRILGGSLVAICMVSPVALGIVGLLPGTLETVKGLSDTAQSLSQVDPARAGATPAAGPRDQAPPEVFEKLAVKAGNALFPLSHGRERVIVVVPDDQIPKTRFFPEWLKMATLSRIQLPVGWHWEESIYSAHYRKASATLDAQSIAALDAKWVIVSNVFQRQVPVAVAVGLSDRTRFAPFTTVREGNYYMTLFRVLP